MKTSDWTKDGKIASCLLPPTVWRLWAKYSLALEGNLSEKRSSKLIKKSKKKQSNYAKTWEGRNADDACRRRKYKSDPAGGSDSGNEVIRTVTNSAYQFPGWTWPHLSRAANEMAQKTCRKKHRDLFWPLLMDNRLRRTMVRRAPSNKCVSDVTNGWLFGENARAPSQSAKKSEGGFHGSSWNYTPQRDMIALHATRRNTRDTSRAYMNVWAGTQNVFYQKMNRKTNGCGLVVAGCYHGFLFRIQRISNDGGTFSPAAKCWIEKPETTDAVQHRVVLTRLNSDVMFFTFAGVVNAKRPVRWGREVPNVRLGGGMQLPNVRFGGGPQMSGLLGGRSQTRTKLATVHALFAAKSTRNCDVCGRDQTTIV